eukprot:gene11029-18631_t
MVMGLPAARLMFQRLQMGNSVGGQYLVSGNYIPHPTKYRRGHQQPCLPTHGGSNLSRNGNSIIRKITAEGTGTVSTAAGSGAWGSLNGLSASAKLTGPESLAFLANGDMIICDTGNSALRKLTFATDTVSTFAGIPGSDGEVDGPALGIALFGMMGPTSIAIDSSDNVYVADYGNFLIRLVSGGMVSTVAGDSANPAYLDDATAPAYVVLDAAESFVYFSDDANYRLPPGCQLLANQPSLASPPLRAQCLTPVEPQPGDPLTLS